MDTLNFPSSYDCYGDLFEIAQDKMFEFDKEANLVWSKIKEGEKIVGKIVTIQISAPLVDVCVALKDAKGNIVKTYSSHACHNTRVSLCFTQNDKPYLLEYEGGELTCIQDRNVKFDCSAVDLQIEDTLELIKRNSTDNK